MASRYRILASICLGVVCVAAREASLKVSDPTSSCRTGDVSRITGIGLDLTTSYAVAAIRNPDGTVDNLMKISADEEYKELMVKLADPLSISPCQNPKCISERTQCWVLRSRRHWNKLRGLPSTPEVGIIANFLLVIEKALYAEIGPVNSTRFLPVLPALPGSSQEDLADAMEYAGFGLSSAQRHSDSGEGTEINAVFAGMGRGLCKNHCQQEKCKLEETSMAWSFVLSVNFDNASLSVSHNAIRSAYISLETSYKTDFELGGGHIPKSAQDQQLFWQRIRDTVIAVGSQADDISDILIRGENADEPKLIDTVKDAAAELFPNQPGKLKQLFAETSHPDWEPLFVAARGAAELDKRAQDVRRDLDSIEEGRLDRQSNPLIVGEVFNDDNQIVLDYFD